MKTKKITFTVTEEYAGQRLDRYLATHAEISSRSYAHDLIEKNLVSVDGKLAKPSLTLKENQTVEIQLPEKPTESALIPYDFKLDIVYEDNDLLVVNKPSGLVVHPAAGHQQDTLVNALLYHTKDLSMKNEQRPGIVHRIDKETSGLLVVAKNDRTHDDLAQQFKDKKTHRVYYAVVDGFFPRPSGTIQSYLARHPGDRKRYASLKGDNQTGKWAVTHYKKIAQSSGMSYMKIELETGRTHQIRVHMSEANHKLIGDVVYGYPQQKIKAYQLKRFYLHAAELGFIHPTTKKEMLFKAPWPDEDIQKLTELGFKNDIFTK